jgi:hypothetical protein
MYSIKIGDRCQLDIPFLAFLVAVVIASLAPTKFSSERRYPETV